MVLITVSVTVLETLAGKLPMPVKVLITTPVTVLTTVPVIVLTTVAMPVLDTLLATGAGHGADQCH